MTKPLYAELCDLAERLIYDTPEESCDGNCDPAVRRDGAVFLIFGSAPRASVIEEWAKALRERAHVPLDWHYAGGRAVFRAVVKTEADAWSLRDAVALLLPVLEWVHHVAQVREPSRVGPVPLCVSRYEVKP